MLKPSDSILNALTGTLQTQPDELTLNDKLILFASAGRVIDDLLMLKWMAVLPDETVGDSYFENLQQMARDNGIREKAICGKLRHIYLGIIELTEWF